MKKFFVLSIILFLCLPSFVGCNGVTTPTTVPDDGGMGSYDSQFISLLNKLYNPWKLMDYLIDNIQYTKHTGIYTPYEFYLKKEGDCADYSVFSCYVLHYHDYVVYSVCIYFLYEPGEPAGHAITVFEHKATDQYFGFPYLAKYGYLSNHSLVLELIPPEGLDSIKDCVDDYMERWGEGYNLDYYTVNPWNYCDYKGGK